MKDAFPRETADETRQALIDRLSRRVRDLRREMGLPRRVVSERSGVSPRYLAQLEAGEGNISIALLERVARALDVRIEALIAERLPSDQDAERIARLYAQAGEDVQRQVRQLLGADNPTRLKSGRICLLGLRGAGKTSLGRELAKELNVPFVETNDLIQEETGIPLAEVLSLYGQDGYRRLEAEALEKLSARGGPMVLAVSGGLVEQDTPFASLLDSFHTVWLRATPEEHVERVRRQGELGPLRDAPDATARIGALMEVRGPLYARAEAQLDTTGKTPVATLKQLVGLIRAHEFLSVESD